MAAEQEPEEAVYGDLTMGDDVDADSGERLGEELTLKKTLGILVVLLGAAVILLRSRLHREEALPDNQLKHHRHHHFDHRVKTRH